MGLILVTGGARSGKSMFAEKLVQQYAIEKGEGDQVSDVLYIATAIPFDDEMKERVRRHQAQRPAHWRTVEQYQNLDQVFQQAPEKVVLLDCITVMVTNLLFSAGLDEENPTTEEINAVEEMITREIDKMLVQMKQNPSRELIMVTNELGMGLVPAYPLGRIFRDIAGRVNQRLAAASDQVYFVISGIPTQIKGGGR